MLNKHLKIKVRSVIAWHVRALESPGETLEVQILMLDLEPSEQLGFKGEGLFLPLGTKISAWQFTISTEKRYI